MSRIRSKSRSRTSANANKKKRALPDFFDRSFFASWHRHILIAGAFLTCLPWPKPGGRRRPGDLSQSARAFPLIGCLVALPAGTLLWGLLSWGVAPLAACLICTAAITLMTGGLHEDGLADSFDGLFASGSRTARLNIMSQGNIGAFGLLALVFAFIMRAALPAGMAPLDMVAAIVAAAAASRAGPVILAYRLNPARRDGLGATFGKPPAASCHAAVILAAVFLFLFLGPVAGCLAALSAIGALKILEHLAVNRIGGVNGDIMGASQQIAEVAILLAAAIAL